MRAIAFCLLLFAATGARAADLQLNLKASDGTPVREAVVTLYPEGGTPAPAIAGNYVMTQKNIQFSPYVLMVPLGATVRFPNEDKVRHHVYSFSKPARFELKLYGRDTTHARLFDKAGTVALGCNIHDQMQAFIRVVDSGLAEKSGSDGRISFKGLPQGRVTVKVWHPHLRGKDNELVTSLYLGNDKAAVENLALDVRPSS